MTRKQVLELLDKLGIDNIVYEDIKYYLSANGWKLKDITDIQYCDPYHCILEVNNIVVGCI